MKLTKILRKNGGSMKENRRKQIEALITERRSISMSQLCEELGVSMNTIRADVKSLIDDDVIEKVYGGIILKGHADIPLYERRNLQHVDMKNRVAEAAEKEIVDGDIVYLDSGTTTLRVLDYLDPKKQITIVTPNLAAVIRAQNLFNVSVMMLPGTYNRRTNAFLDSSTIEYLTRFQHTKALLGVSAITAEGNMGVSNWLEYELKKAAILHSQHRILLADSTKFGRTGLLTFGTLSEMDSIYINKEVPDAFIEICSSQHVNVVRC